MPAQGAALNTLMVTPELPSAAPGNVTLVDPKIDAGSKRNGHGRGITKAPNKPDDPHMLERAAFAKEKCSKCGLRALHFTCKPAQLVAFQGEKCRSWRLTETQSSLRWID